MRRITRRDEPRSLLSHLIHSLSSVFICSNLSTQMDYASCIPSHRIHILMVYIYSINSQLIYNPLVSRNMIISPS